MKPQPSTMNSTTIDTFVMTIRPLTSADSRMPRMSSSDSAATIRKAGTFMMPWAVTAPLASTSFSNGECDQAYGTCTPTYESSLLRYSLQAMPTVAAPMAYSSTRSQPMIQAMSSPMVAYVYV